MVVGRLYVTDETRVVKDLLNDGDVLIIKPKSDTHLNYIFKGLGIVSNEADDYQIFDAFAKFAETIEKTPYAVDKLFWLIGSGNFYKNVIQLNPKPNKKRFVKEALDLIKKKEEEE